MTPGLSFALAALSLGCAATGSLIHLKARRRQIRLNERRDAVLVEGPPSVRPVAARSSRRTPKDGRHPSRFARVMGYDLARRHTYPTNPFAMVAAALLPAGVGGWIASLFLGSGGILSALAVWPLIARTCFGRCHSRYRETLFEQFPDALAMIVRSVRVGIPVTEAIKTVGQEAPAPTSATFASLATQMAIGLPLDEGLRTMANVTGLAEYRFFATALSLQTSTGGNLGETLDGLADVIRKRVAARARGYALASEARMSAMVLCGAPFLFFGLLWYMDPDYASVLVGTHRGLQLLGATVSLLAGGMLCMRVMIAKALS